MSDKFVNFTDYDLSQYLKLIEKLFEVGRYNDAKETARHLMHYCDEKERDRVRDSSPTL